MEFQNIQNRHLGAALLTVMLGFISPVGLAGDSDRGHHHHHRGPTILDKLERTDGVQALVAAIQVVDQPSVAGLRASQADCSGLTELLDNRQAQIVLLAPNNNAFEKFLKLPKGGFDGMGSDTIALALPGILARLGSEPPNLCKVLLKHVSVGGNSRITASGLLRQGGITVADESELPVAVGNVGPSIAYQANITERDVFTVNGVIHYIDNVIVEPEEPPGVDPRVICDTVDACRVSELTSADCHVFVSFCEAAGQDQEDCAQGATLICIETELGGP